MDIWPFTSWHLRLNWITFISSNRLTITGSTLRLLLLSIISITQQSLSINMLWNVLNNLIWRLTLLFSHVQLHSIHQPFYSRLDWIEIHTRKAKIISTIRYMYNNLHQSLGYSSRFFYREDIRYVTSKVCFTLCIFVSVKKTYQPHLTVELNTEIVRLCVYR